MIGRLKSAVKSGLTSLAPMLNRQAAGRFLSGELIASAMRRTRDVVHDGTTLTFAAPNALNDFRIDTFSVKEPETLDWIDQIPARGTLWDIGANVGLYSCYAAKRRACRVLAFEPSVFNLELLARNVYLNGLTERVTIVPLPLAESLSVSRLNMSSTEWGAALSTFGSSIGFDGAPIRKVFEFSTVGISVDDATRLLELPPPDFMKLDVDGIEHLILKGAVQALRHVESVLVEINDAFAQQSEEAERCLTNAGLTLKSKRRWTEGGGGPHDATYNQIWHRSE